MEETLSPLHGEELKIHREYLYHLQSVFCRSNLLAVCWGCPSPLGEKKPPFALAAGKLKSGNRRLEIKDQNFFNAEKTYRA